MADNYTVIHEVEAQQILSQPLKPAMVHDGKVVLCELPRFEIFQKSCTCADCGIAGDVIRFEKQDNEHPVYSKLHMNLYSNMGEHLRMMCVYAADQETVCVKCAYKRSKANGKNQAADPNSKRSKRKAEKAGMLTPVVQAHVVAFYKNRTTA